MNKYLLYMFLMLGAIQQFHSQESNGIVALALPVRNSLKFNRYSLNPTFSFAREQNKYISFTNKRQLAQFNDAPESYLFSYSGRFAENIGAGVGLFQQNIGVLTTFGGIMNFAYNVNFSDDNNLTFGLNLGAYQSGINQGKVILNSPDTALENVPSSFALTVTPGINYGTSFLDFGLSISNLVTYNLNTSEIIADNPEQALQAHVMYTGYMNSRGFFDESKFTTLLRSEFKNDQTILSGVAMLTVPKGIWAQAGYNTVFGASAGVGLNVTKNIAVEYNYEQSMGDLSEFGSSHEITVAYRFNNKFRYNYSNDDQEQSLFNAKRKKAKASSISAEERAKAAERRAAIIAERKALAEAKTNKVEPENLSAIAQEEDKIETESTDGSVKNENTQDLDNTKALEDAKAKEEARLKLEAEQKAELARKQEEAKRKAAIEAEKSRIEEERRRAIEEAAKVEAEEERRKLEEAKRKAELEAKAKLEAEEAAKLKLEAEAKAEAEKKLSESEILNESVIANDIAKEDNNIEEKATDNVSAESIIDNENSSNDEMVPEAEDEEFQTLKTLTEATEKAKKEQRELLNNLSESIAIKQQDLDDLKEENDLSEQGVYQAPKKFKSVAAENAKIEELKDEIEKIEKEQEAKMIELEALLIKRKRKYRKDRQGINDFYKKTIAELKQEQLRIKNYKSALIANLEKIRAATDFERKRRISRAAYDNQQDRYKKDKAALNRIKETTQESLTPLKESDFDFGEEQTKNIQIVNNVVNEEPGYYMVIAVHDDISKRDEFVSKVVASGEKNVNFFFDVKTNKYFIYYEKFDQIGAAKSAMEKKGSEPYNTKMSLVKIEN